MITFNCKKCGQKFNVPETHAGKKGRCPKCKYIIDIPNQAEYTHPDKSIHSVSFTCSMCEKAIKVPESSRGKLIECPQCGCFTEVPTGKIKESAKSTIEEGITDGNFETPPEPEREMAEEESKTPEKHKLPRFLDILLYPTSRGGLISLGVIMILRLSTDFVSGFLMCCFYGGILSIILRIIIVYSYMYWYFSECISDSAVGGLRAPETFASMPGLFDMLCQWFRLFACYAFSLGPVTFYLGYMYYHEIEPNRIIQWSLLTYGIFFFPMGALAVIMFDSVNGLNPVLLISSIFSTLIQYCGLVILFYGFSILSYIFRSLMIPIMNNYKVISSMFFAYLVFHILTIYTLLILGHLLGRFYWRYQEKLNWEV